MASGVLIFFIISAQLFLSQGDKFDLEQFAFDLFGDRSAAEHLKGPLPAAADLQSSCRDYSTSCQKYLKYCNEVSLVKRFCRVTCKVCTNKPVIPIISEPCEDRPNFMCIARKEQGMCEIYKKKMKEYCPQTCGFCPTTEEECKDNKDAGYCNHITKLGYCSSLNTIKLASQSCKKTCKLCSKDLKCGVVKLKGIESEVIAGISAKKGRWPWQVAIYFKDEYLCGGSLINSDTVISAAHCFNVMAKDLTGYKIVLGEHNRDYKEGSEQYKYVSKLVMHKKFYNVYDDIALLKLRTKAWPTNEVVPICLPKANSEVKPGTMCYMTGWGKVTHPGHSVAKLQQAGVPVVSLSECQKVNNRPRTKVTDKMICGGDRRTFKGGCHGDSGGPFVCKNSEGVWELRGIMSWGSSDCNALEKYTVFTKVSKYIDWIKENMSS